MTASSVTTAEYWCAVILTSQSRIGEGWTCSMTDVGADAPEAPTNPGLYERVLVSLPGIWIDGADRDLAFTMQRLLGMAADQFNEAVLACELFAPLNAKWLSAMLASPSTLQGARVSVLVGMYAKAFVYCLDATRAFLSVLAGQPGVPAPTVENCRVFQDSFGFIREVRNSLQHIEERALGLGRNNQPLNVQLLGLGSFIGNRFGVTTAAGCYVDIEIGEATLQQVRAKLEKVLWSVPWLGTTGTLVSSPQVAHS